MKEKPSEIHEELERNRSQEPGQAILNVAILNGAISGQENAGCLESVQQQKQEKLARKEQLRCRRKNEVEEVKQGRMSGWGVCVWGGGGRGGRRVFSEQQSFPANAFCPPAAPNSITASAP